MKCIILAAGYATRLYPLTKDRPKPLLPVGGRPILDWLVDDLAPIADGFIVVSNHRFAEQFEAWAKGAGRPIRVLDDGTESNETRLGAVKDIRLAAEDLTEDALVMAGDNVLTFSLKPFVRFAREKDASCVMCHKEERPEALRRTAVITVDGDDGITSYEEKPHKPRGDLAVPPFYWYKHRDLDRIDEALAEGCGYDAPGSFAAWLSARTRMYAWRMPGSRYDIGDMASYESIRDAYKGVMI